VPLRHIPRARQSKFLMAGIFINPFKLYKFQVYVIKLKKFAVLWSQLKVLEIKTCQEGT
jgi:hypothetical protein